MKKAISIRLDPEIIDFFRIHFPEGYQKGISWVLHGYVKDRATQLDQLVGRAQQIFITYHSQCFWHMRKDLKITAALLPMVRDGLRHYGGKRGFQLAEELNPLTQDDLCR